MRPPVTPSPVDSINRHIAPTFRHVNQYALSPPSRELGAVPQFRLPRLRERYNRVLPGILRLFERHRGPGEVEGVGKILCVETRRDGKLTWNKETVSKLSHTV